MSPRDVSSPARFDSLEVPLGGLPKDELLRRLHEAGVRVNAHALALFADARFTTTPAPATVEVATVSVASLGFADGATYAALVARADRSGLVQAPLELAPRLRLVFLRQPEGSIGHATVPGRAPPGAITVASPPLDDDDETPKGFYLRRIDGTLWLRGYRSSASHVCAPHDRFAFVVRRGG